MFRVTCAKEKNGLNKFVATNHSTKASFPIRFVRCILIQTKSGQMTSDNCWRLEHCPQFFLGNFISFLNYLFLVVLLHFLYNFLFIVPTEIISSSRSSNQWKQSTAEPLHWWLSRLRVNRLHMRFQIKIHLQAVDLSCMYRFCKQFKMKMNVQIQTIRKIKSTKSIRKFDFSPQFWNGQTENPLFKIYLSPEI